MVHRYAVALVAVFLMPSPAIAKPRDYLKKPDSWFVEGEAKQVAASILSYQSELGGWPKNTDTTGQPYQGDRQDLKPTYDNGATTDELRYLARIHVATNEDVYLNAFSLGLDYILNGQYGNGGWPQSYPPGKGYPRHITFNDDAMVRLLEFADEVATSKDYHFVDAARRQLTKVAFDRGIACILKCQIIVDGTLTAWCAQHDAVDFHPQSARPYELATLSGSESVGITRLLMSIDAPSPEVVGAIEASIQWLEKVKLTGIRVSRVKDERAPKGLNKIVIDDLAAPPLWARFYEIGTDKPVFVDRDGIPKQELAEIGYERRNGYSWYGTRAQQLLEVEYPEWKNRLNVQLRH